MAKTWCDHPEEYLGLPAPPPDARALDWAKLTVSEKILMLADGTLTHLLEVLAGEAMRIHKLREALMQPEAGIPVLDTMPQQSLLHREILLQGARTQKTHVYAESFIVIARLPERFRQGLLETNEPIGKLWRSCRLETYKEILCHLEHAAGPWAGHFGCLPSTTLLSRTYRVFSSGCPTMLITEKMPLSRESLRENTLKRHTNTRSNQKKAQVVVGMQENGRTDPSVAVPHHAKDQPRKKRQ
jgi:chorismate-pyruvate lyase